MPTILTLETDPETIAVLLSIIMQDPEDAESWTQLLMRLMVSKNEADQRAQDEADILHPAHGEQYASTLFAMIGLAGKMRVPIVESRGLMAMAFPLLTGGPELSYTSDPHALLRLALHELSLRDAAPVSVRTILKTMDSLLDTGTSLVYTEPSQRVKAVCTAAFGAIWWELRGILDGNKFDPYTIILERPPWQAGRFLNRDALEALPLPLIDTGPC
jgi:hypothetical protein